MRAGDLGQPAALSRHAPALAAAGEKPVAHRAAGERDAGDAAQGLKRADFACISHDFGVGMGRQEAFSSRFGRGKAWIARTVALSKP